MAEKDKNIELRSDAVRDIIGRPPSWLVRWGTITFAGIILILIVGSAWFNYPDRLSSTVTILSSQPPFEVIARNNGYLKSLFVVDSQQVSENEVLAVLESSVNFDFIKSINPELDSIPFWLGEIRIDELSTFVTKSRARPGNLKNNFASLNSAIKSYISFVSLDKYADKIEAGYKEIKSTRIHFDRLFEQRQLKKDELKLAQKQLNRQKELFDSGTISPLEYESSSQDFLAIKFSFEETRSGLSSYQIQLDQLEQRIAEFKTLNHEERQKLSRDIETKITELQGAISEWELNYLFKSPISGRVSFTGYWAENQSVNEGDRVMTIIQDDEMEIIGKLALPVSGSGKAKVGQTVLVKIDQYPYMEYGVVRGVIKRISLVSDQNYFSVELEFPNGLISSYDRELRLTQGMTGQAEIITENMSFLLRIVNPIRYLINRNKLVE